MASIISYIILSRLFNLTVLHFLFRKQENNNTYLIDLYSGLYICYPLQYSWASLVAELVKNPLAMWET